MTAEQLPLEGLPEPPEPDPALSPDRRRTQLRRELLAAGVHPATRLPLLRAPDPSSCGDCVFFARLDWHNRTYLKCTKAGVTHGAGTDMRRSWPACNAFRPAGSR
jgi:hypothetical protein